MNETIANGQQPSLSRVLYRNPDLSWVGSNPLRDGFCYGLDDGGLVFTEESQQDPYFAINGSASGEPINGFARIDKNLVVSTRRELTFWKCLPGNGKLALGSMYPHGAHDVIATTSGYFVSPLGRSGFMSVKASLDEDIMIYCDDSEKNEVDFYRVVQLSSNGANDVFAFACRTGGIAATELIWGQGLQSLSTMKFRDLDVVDVCKIGTENMPHAIAAIGHDATIVLLKNALHDKSPYTVKYDHIQGVAYRLLSCRGNLILLTSDALYILAGLAKKFVDGEAFENLITPIDTIPMKAVDISICKDNGLLVLLPDRVELYDLELFHKSVSLMRSNEYQGTELTPKWESKFDQMSVHMELALTV